MKQGRWHIPADVLVDIKSVTMTVNVDRCCQSQTQAFFAIREQSGRINFLNKSFLSTTFYVHSL